VRGDSVSAPPSTTPDALPCGCALDAARECPHDDDRTQDDRDSAVLDRETE
jgi:hypothetical protein